MSTPQSKSLPDRASSLLKRYARAAQLTAPKTAAELPGLGVDGYWIDRSRFFFLKEQFEPSLGRTLSVPAIADAESQLITEAVPLKEMLDLLRSVRESPVDVEELSLAMFDMPDSGTLAVALAGVNYLIDIHRLRVISSRRVVDEPALYSPDRRHACFLRGHNIWLRELETGTERALTHDGTLHNCYAQQPEASLSAVSYRKNPAPLGLWSEDSQWILTHRVDERSLPEMPLVEHAPPNGGRPVLHQYKYPVPGDPLPVTTYVAIHVPSGRVVSFDAWPDQMLSFSAFIWRTAWFSGTDTAWFVRFGRYFKEVELVRLDLAEGIGHVVIQESVASGYVELHQMLGATPNVRTLLNSGEIIWFSERDGWGHLYLYDAATGAAKGRITEGQWLVRDILHVDEINRRVVFSACGVDKQADPARRTVCAVDLDGSNFEILFSHDGDIAVPRTEPGGMAHDRPFCPSYAPPGLSLDGTFGVVRYANVARGNRTEIVDMRTRRGFVMAALSSARGDVLPVHFSAMAADGTTPLYGVLFFPSDFDRKRRYPLVDYIYPGPQVTWQPQSFRSVHSAQARAMAELGFVTLMLDTRCMPFRSRALHQIGYGELLEPQLADHAAVIRVLCERYDFIRSDRVGIFGYSGGGAAAARALLDHGSTFKVGVSVCGNHDSSFNVSVWSDKYRGAFDAARWPHQANGAVAHKLTGKLLLVSGDMDENVHVSHTLSLADALIRANRDFDLLIVPNEGHLVLMTNGYVQRRTWDYFVTHLLGETPPEGFEIKFESHELACMKRNWIRELQ